MSRSKKNIANIWRQAKTPNKRKYGVNLRGMIGSVGYGLTYPARLLHKAAKSTGKLIMYPFSTAQNVEEIPMYDQPQMYDTDYNDIYNIYDRTPIFIPRISKKQRNLPNPLEGYNIKSKSRSRRKSRIPLV